MSYSVEKAVPYLGILTLGLLVGKEMMRRRCNTRIAVANEIIENCKDRVKELEEGGP